jgi:hypothetical protein
MGCDEELSHSREIVCTGCFDEVLHSLVFCDYVAGSLVWLRLFERGVAERSYADFAAGCLAFGYACAVSGVSERVFHHGVHGQDRYVIGERDGFRFETAAVDFQGRVIASEDGDILVHDAAGHAYEVGLGALAESGYFEAVQFAILQECQGCGYFQGRRGAQACSFGDCAFYVER